MFSFAGGHGISASALPASRRFIRPLVSLLLLGSPAVLCAALNPVIGPEFLLDPPVLGPSPCTRAAPAVAVNYSGYLAVWSHGKGEATFPGVYAARVDPLGNLLDPFGILVSGAAAEQTTCKVAALADGFLVTWSAPHGNSTTDWDILAARVSNDGAVLDSTPLPVCTVSGVQSSPAVAANGDNCLVVWADSRGTGIYGSIVAPDGGLYPTNGLPICTAAYEQFTPSVASVGTNYLVVWQDYRHSTASVYASDIYGARVSGSGVLLDTNGIAICRRPSSQYEPAVAGNGTNYLVVWDDHDLQGNDILGARVGADGVVWDTNALVVAHAPNASLNPVVAGNFNDFLVVWQDYRDSPATNYAARIYATRVRDDGSIEYPGGIPLSSGGAEQSAPAAAGFWDDFLVVWQDTRNDLYGTLADVYGAAVDSGRGLFAYPDSEISVSRNAQLAPKIALCGTNFIAVWADNRNGTTNGWDIYGARLDQQGTPLDAFAIPVCVATNHQTDATIAASGTKCLVVWTDLRNSGSNASSADIYGALVDSSGTILSPGAFAICRATNDQTRPVVAPLGENFLVVWQDARNSLSNALRWDIYGTRVSGNADILDPDGIALCTNLANQTTPALAGNPTQALVVWTDSRPGSNTDVYGARVAADGTLLDTNALPICTVTGVQSGAALATDGDGFLVAWTDGRTSAAAPDIYGVRVSRDGWVSPTNGFPIRVAPGQQSAPTVAFNGWDYLVAWQEARSTLSNSFDIFATGVTPEGAVFGGGPLLVNTNAYNQLAPAAGAGADGRFLVFNQGFQFLAQRAVGNYVNLEAIPRLDSAVASEGQFQMRLRCAPGENYSLETSEDLQKWSPFANLVSTNYSIWFADPAAANMRQRFYRASLLP